MPLFTYRDITVNLSPEDWEFYTDEKKKGKIFKSKYNGKYVLRREYSDAEADRKWKEEGGDKPRKTRQLNLDILDRAHGRYLGQHVDIEYTNEDTSDLDRNNIQLIEKSGKKGNKKKVKEERKQRRVENDVKTIGEEIPERDDKLKEVLHPIIAEMKLLHETVSLLKEEIKSLRKESKDRHKDNEYLLRKNKELITAVNNHSKEIRQCKEFITELGQENDMLKQKVALLQENWDSL